MMSGLSPAERYLGAPCLAAPWSRLALHGAPLIQGPPRPQRPPPPPNAPASQPPQDNPLPRIIKPRKRRKKDRKPQQSPTPSPAAAPPQQPPAPPPPVVPAPPPPVEPPPPPCQCSYCDPNNDTWDFVQSSPSIWSSDWDSLSVSSQIVTSPNGHRDLEIKFFKPRSSREE